jgi:alpha-L-rhamnosidase
MQTDRQGAKQTAYRIFAAIDPKNLSEGSADLWDSGKIESDQSVHVVYSGQRLESRQRVYWKVTVWDETGSATQSESAWFEMGFLKRKDWKAKWIGAALTGGPRTTIPAPYLRKTFALPGKAQSARLYVTALGLYECSINGQEVGEDVFTPGWTDYRKRVEYNVYDVTKLVQMGENALGVMLGDGWAVGHVGLGHRQTYLRQPRLLAQLEITLTDGRIITVISDRTWTHQFGPILEADMLQGESYDARLEMPGWNAPGFDDKRWLKAEVFDDSGIAIVATNGAPHQRIEADQRPGGKREFYPEKLYFRPGAEYGGARSLQRQRTSRHNRHHPFRRSFKS